MAASTTPVAESSGRRKSGRVIQRPEIFTPGVHQSSAVENGVPGDGYRVSEHTLNDAADTTSHDEVSEAESTASVAEKFPKGKKRQARPTKTSNGASSKRPRIANGTTTSLAIRSGGKPSKNTSQKVKTQNARSRQSQAHQEGLYGVLSRIRKRGSAFYANCPLQRKSSGEVNPAKRLPPGGSSVISKIMSRR